jgi:hypothetical protein
MDSKRSRCGSGWGYPGTRSDSTKGHGNKGNRDAEGRGGRYKSGYEKNRT